MVTFSLLSIDKTAEANNNFRGSRRNYAPLEPFDTQQAQTGTHVDEGIGYGKERYGGPPRRHNVGIARA